MTSNLKSVIFFQQTGKKAMQPYSLFPQDIGTSPESTEMYKEM